MELKDIILKKGDIVYYKPSINGKTLNFKVDRFLDIERPTGYETIYEAPKEILDKEEKKYLEGVIRPFKDRVEYIFKRKSLDVTFHEPIVKYYLGFKIDDDFIYFPKFETMYKGMEVNKEYTLEELGLFKGE